MGTKKFPGKSLVKNSKLTFNFTWKSPIIIFLHFLQGNLFIIFPKKYFETILQKLSPRGCFWKFSKISQTSPKFNTHKKVVVHFFITMLLLPKTHLLIYPNMKRFKGPKTHSLFTFTFTFHKVDSGDRSALYSGLYSRKPI